MARVVSDTRGVPWALCGVKMCTGGSPIGPGRKLVCTPAEVLPHEAFEVFNVYFEPLGESLKFRLLDDRCSGKVGGRGLHLIDESMHIHPALAELIQRTFANLEHGLGGIASEARALPAR